MAHLIEMNADGSAKMAFVGDRRAIWHRLGTQVPEGMEPTPQEMMELAGADWDVHKITLNADLNGTSIPTGHSALIRDTDLKVLDVVTDSWEPVQNSEAFAFFDEFVKAGQMKMDTAGVLKDGKVVWALAKVGEGFTVFGKDDVESYLLFSNPHEFGRCVDIKFTPVRVVCNNTLTYALSDVSEDQVRLTHRRKFDAERVKTVLGIAHNRLDKYKEAAEFLGNKKYNDETVTQYFQRIFPVLTTKRESKKELSKQGQRAVELLETQPGADIRPGSMWNLFNAATYITSNEYGKSEENRLNSLWYGQNRERNQRALNLALELAETV